MAPLDTMVNQELEARGVANAGWTIFRDDGYLVLLGGMEDVGVVEEVLATLHPSIRWEVNPTVPPLVSEDGS